MVRTNNNLKNKSQTKNTEEKGLPVYPFTVDVNSFPERKYLLGLYKIAKFSYVSLFISIALCLFIIIRSFSLSVNPVFIYWNEIENKFLFNNSKNSSIPKEDGKIINYYSYLNEYFVRTYIKKRFEISDIYANNYKNWCECSNSSSSISKMGIFNLEESCYLCRFSSSSIYKLFLDNEKNAFEKLSQTGIKRNVEILNISTIYMSEDSSEQSFIENLMGNTKTINIRNSYKVDFIVQTVSKEKIIEQDVLIAYIDIQGPKFSPEKRGVISASYIFNPNYELVLSNYLKSKEEQNDAR